MLGTLLQLVFFTTDYAEDHKVFYPESHYSPQITQINTDYIIMTDDVAVVGVFHRGLIVQDLDGKVSRRLVPTTACRHKSARNYITIVRTYAKS